MADASKLIVNEMLSYVNFLINLSTYNSIKKVIRNFYLPFEICEAKDVSYLTCGGLGDKPVCNALSNRSKQEALLLDILADLKKVGGIRGEYPGLCFCSAGQDSSLCTRRKKFFRAYQ